MINWLIGGLIIGLTVFIIAKAVINIKKGKSCCGCSGCKSECSGCSNYSSDPQK